MPMQSGQSPLLAKLGKRLVDAAEQHRNDEVIYSGFSELPPIDAGIAQLVDCKFTQIKPGKTNAGDWMFYAAAVVVSPKEVNGIPVEGQRTQISEPLFDTPTRTRQTLADHVAFVQNEMKKLGATPEGLGAANLEATAAALKRMQPYIRFRTWKGDVQTTGPYAGKEPRVNHNWNGTCDYSENGEMSGVQDNTPSADTEPEIAEEPDANPEFGDLDSLIAAADGGDDAAKNTLNDMATAAGVDADAVNAAENWTEVGQLILAAQGGGEATIEEEQVAEVKPEAEEAWEPKKGDVYQYKPIDPKTKKPYVDPKTKKAKKAIEVEVLAVDAKTNTVKLKNLTNPKVTYDKVKWDDLESAE